MKIKNILLLFISLLIINVCYSVEALEYNYYLSTKDLNYEYRDKDSIKIVNVQRGDYIYVTSVINYTGGTVNSYQLGKGKLTLKWDSNYVDLIATDGKYYTISNGTFNDLSVSSINKTSGKLTIGEFSSNNMIDLGKNILMQFKFQVLKNANTNSFKIYQMAGEDSINCFDTLNNKTVKCMESLYTELKYNIQKSSNNKLSSILLDNHELDYFNEDMKEYDIEVEKDVDHINISATKKDNNSVIGGDLGNKKLEYGINTFNINVISESGETNTYTLNITRIDERSTVNTLKSLTISDIDFIFSSNITEYDLDVNNKVDKITISSVLSDSKALYADGFGNREEKLNEGSNKILIKVLSESGDERVYTLNITRALSGNNTLKSLMVNDEKIPLTDSEFIYNYEVETEVDKVIVKAVASDAKATINLKDSYELEIGDNEINIDIIAPDGSRASYILNITRKKVLSNNSRLSNIKIIGYKINFKPEETLYHLRVKDEEEKLDIYTVPEDTYATVEIEGNNDLIDGSIIKINVKAENDTYTRYFINIEKSRKSNTLLIIIIILILSGLLALCIMTLIKRKKREEEKKKELQEKIIDEGKESDSLGEDIDIEASDYDTEVDESVQEEVVSHDEAIMESDVDSLNVSNDENPGLNSIISDDDDEKKDIF